MLNQMLMKGIMGLSLSFVSALGFSASIEGYWKSIEERTGEQLSIVEIRKGNDGRYHGKIVYRYPNSHGIALTNCSKCPAPFTNKPISFVTATITAAYLNLAPGIHPAFVLIKWLMPVRK